MGVLARKSEPALSAVDFLETYTKLNVQASNQDIQPVRSSSTYIVYAFII